MKEIEMATATATATETRKDGPTMEWLVHYAIQRRQAVCRNAFFQALPVMDEAAVRRWLPDLEFFGHRFIQALMLRAGVCPRDSPLLHTFMQHAYEEGPHPAQIWRWMEAHGYGHGGRPTPATFDLAELCLWSAREECPDEQVVRHNLGGEAYAEEFFRQMDPVVTRLGINDSEYWHVHRIDHLHMRLGVDRMVPVSPAGAFGVAYRQIIDLTAMAFHRMFMSWLELAGQA
jgi:hypothetical protein